MGKLFATGLAALKEPGRYGDGNGLFLAVGTGGAASWIVRVQKDGKRRDIGLGSLSKVPLGVARKRAAEARAQIEVGVNPVTERKRAAGVPTFQAAAAIVYAAQRKAWANNKHDAQWLSTLTTYAFPIIGDLTVDKIGREHLLDVLAPIWLAKHETARRVRQRIGSVLDWAYVKGFRDTEAPLRAISKGLPRVTAARGHHSAMPYGDVAAFVARLRQRETIGRLALEAAILTAGRSGEVRGATWGEVDLEAALWTIPAERMKMGRSHVVPLAPAALSVLRRALALRTGDAELVFPGAKRGKPLSDNTLVKVLKDMGETFTAHGFRSAFKDWAGEVASFPNELSEAALAHAIPNKSEAAYRRGTLLDRRRAMMAAWADYCDAHRGFARSVVRA